MLLQAAPVLLALSSLVSARCGTSHPSEHLKSVHRASKEFEAGFHTRAAAANFTQVIDTYVHVIKPNATAPDYNRQIINQIAVLNRHYTGTGFSFNLASVQSHVNASWQNIAMDSQEEYDMKSSLRQGTYQDLNLYLDTIFADDDELLGYANFPEVDVTAEVFAVDGVVIDPATLPGGKPPYNLGITGVHEVGHWLSLLHTFNPDESVDPESGCVGAGDHIADTPAEQSAAFGCEVGRDSCPGQPGLDAIHNFMDYSDDSCLNQFSRGQVVRMQSLFSQLRATTPPPSRRRRRL